MIDDRKPKRGNGNADKRVAFDYIKSSNFRTIQADGAIGGLTPSGKIHFALYSERQPIPRRLVHNLNTDGSLGPIIQEESVSRDAIVREMEIDIFLNFNVARSLYQWLGQQIEEWNQVHGKAKGTEADPQ